MTTTDTARIPAQSGSADNVDFPQAVRDAYALDEDPAANDEHMNR